MPPYGDQRQKTLRKAYFCGLYVAALRKSYHRWHTICILPTMGTILTGRIFSEKHSPLVQDVENRLEKKDATERL